MYILKAESIKVWFHRCHRFTAMTEAIGCTFAGPN